MPPVGGGFDGGRTAMYGGSGHMKGSSYNMGGNSVSKYKQGGNYVDFRKKAPRVSNQEQHNGAQTYDNGYLDGLYDYVKGWFSGNDTHVEEEEGIDMTLVEDTYAEVFAVIKEKTQSLITLLIK